MTTDYGRYFAALFSSLVLLNLWNATPAAAQVSLLAAAEGDGEARIDAALAKRVSFQFVDTPLRDIMQFVAEQTGLTCRLSKKIEDAGVQANHPVTFSADNLPVESALQLLLRDLNLTLMVQHGMVIVTNVEDAQSPENQTTRVYPVADLVEVVRIPASQGGGLELDYDPLIETITTTIEPDSWSDVGGPGSVKEFENSRSLVISARRDIHQKVAALLVTLRKAKGLQGIRSLSLPAAAELTRPSTPSKLSAPLPVPRREAAARIRVRPLTPEPQPATVGGLF
jgi:hypothetical protein